MAVAANAPRLAATRLLSHQVEALAIAIGMVLKEYRDYERGLAKPSKVQEDVAKDAGTTQATISNLETGKSAPKDGVLRKVFKSIGLDPRSEEGAALFGMLCAVRDHGKAITKLEKHQPS